MRCRESAQRLCVRTILRGMILRGMILRGMIRRRSYGGLTTIARWWRNRVASDECVCESVLDRILRERSSFLCGLERSRPPLVAFVDVCARAVRDAPLAHRTLRIGAERGLELLLCRIEVETVRVSEAEIE